MPRGTAVRIITDPKWDPNNRRTMSKLRGAIGQFLMTDGKNYAVRPDGTKTTPEDVIAVLCRMGDPHVRRASHAACHHPRP